MTRWIRATLLVALAAACGRGAAPPRGAVFEDATGRPVAMPHLPVHRIVSTMQSMTEWLDAMHADTLLVARTDYDHQPALQRLPSIGGGLDPSPEVVASLHPDVVIGWRNRSSVALESALAPFHIPVLSFETTDTADAFANLERLGVLIGRAALADSLAAALRARFVSVHRSACDSATGPPESVLLVLSIDPPQTAGRGTWLDTVLETACLRNAFDDMRTPWPTVSLEAIAARNPDWILVAGGVTDDDLNALKTKPGWRDMHAVRTGRILQIPADLFARAGPSMADAAEAIVAARRQALHAATR